MKFAPYTKWYEDSIPTIRRAEYKVSFFYIFTRDVTLAYDDDDASRTLDFRDVTLAYDDDVIGDLDFRDVTLAYDDDAKGNKGFRMSH